MEYKTPKVLEKKPVVAGFALKTIVIIVSCALIALFTFFTSYLLSILCILAGVIYVKIEKKYPERGQLVTLLKYTSSTKCIRVNQPITSLIKTK